MPIFDLFSKRKERLVKAGKTEIYIYDDIPQSLRVQIVHIWNDTIGTYSYDFHPPNSNDLWDVIFKILKKEYGLFYLVTDKSGTRISPKDQISIFFQRCDCDKALDIIELSFQLVEKYWDSWISHNKESCKVSQSKSDAIAELNTRFEEHGIGYEFSGGILLRKDNQFIYQEIIKPALSLLEDTNFSGASDEFLSAYKFYRQRDKKQAISEALKAFESTMKAICIKKGWKFPANATAFPLITILVNNGLIPPELNSHFSNLRTSMQSGLPTLSNQTSRHGQGLEQKDVEDYLVEYALNLCATNIVFLVKSYQAHK